MVIRTTAGKDAESGWRQRLESVLKKQTLNPHLARMLRQYERGYQLAIEFIRNHPPGVSVLELEPPQTLQSHTFGSSSAALVNDYALGFEVGMDSVVKTQAWMNSGGQH